MKLIIQLIIKNLVSYFSRIKNLTKIIKTNNIKSLEGIDYTQNYLHNLTFKYSSNIVFYISNITYKIFILLVYLLILVCYFYILYLIHIKVYESSIIEIMTV